MNPTNPETIMLERLLEKYRFVRPVPPTVRESILSSRKKILVRVLGTVGAFSACYGAYLTLYFAVKKTGIGAVLAKCLLAAFTVTSLGYSGYRLVTAPREGPDPGMAAEAPPATTGERPRWTDRITHFNGRVIHGAIVSREDPYVPGADSSSSSGVRWERKSIRTRFDQR